MRGCRMGTARAAAAQASPALTPSHPCAAPAQGIPLSKTYNGPAEIKLADQAMIKIPQGHTFIPTAEAGRIPTLDVQVKGGDDTAAN